MRAVNKALVEPKLLIFIYVLIRNVAEYLGRQDDVFVSAHFMINRRGAIIQIVNPDHFCAFHAGVSSVWHPTHRKFVSGLNQTFIGIELLGDGNLQEYSQEQYKSLGSLCTELIKRYSTIHLHCVAGHEVVSPGRKVDPGRIFDWRRAFAEICSHALRSEASWLGFQ